MCFWAYDFSKQGAENYQKADTQEHTGFLSLPTLQYTSSLPEQTVELHFMFPKNLF